MGKKKVLPTTQVINLFNDLTDAEKAMVFDYIKSQASTGRPKSSKAVAKNLRGEIVCATCGLVKEHANHDGTYSSSHPFASSKSAPAVGKRSSPSSKSAVATAASIGINGGDASDAFRGIAGSSGAAGGD